MLLLILALAACNKPGEDASADVSMLRPGTIHPTSENIPDDAEVDYILWPAEPGARAGSTIEAFLHRLTASDPIVTVGVEEGTKQAMLGTIVHATSDEEGRTYVLDGISKMVRIFDKEGRFLHAFGGAGQGPKEFMAPMGMALGPDGEIIVADGSRHVKIFEPQDATYGLKTLVTLDYNPDDVCLIDDRFYVRGFHRSDDGKETMIHAYSMSGDLLYSFGGGYRAPHPSIRAMMSRGEAMACSEEANTVMILFEFLPTIYGFAPDGSLKWTVKLGDFAATTITEMLSDNGHPALRYSKPEPGDVFVRHMAAFPRGEVAIQLIRAGSRPYFYDTYLLSAQDGRGFRLEEFFPLLFGGASGQVLVGASVPFPQVKVYQP